MSTISRPQLLISVYIALPLAVDSTTDTKARLDLRRSCERLPASEW